MKNIVVIGGGTGSSTILAGLKKYPSNNAVIVTSSDDGGSTGTLRRELGVFPPGDIRQCLLGLSDADQSVRDLYEHRFASGTLAGHAVGNIILAALEQTTGSIEEAIAVASKMLGVQGDVIPVTLSAVLENGEEIVGEHIIDDESTERESPVARLTYIAQTAANPRALKAIADADVIVFGPGDLYTSVVPNLLASGIKEVIAMSTATKVLVANIMTKHGQTDGFSVSNFVRVIEEYIGTPIDVVIANDEMPSPEALATSEKAQSEFVVIDKDAMSQHNAKLITANLLSTEEHRRRTADPLSKSRSMIRHDGEKVAKILWDIVA